MKRTIEIYTTRFFSEKYEMKANFGEASSPIIINGEHTGKQVADYRHDPKAAMRGYLEDVVRAGGDDPDDFEAQINKAITALE